MCLWDRKVFHLAWRSQRYKLCLVGWKLDVAIFCPWNNLHARWKFEYFFLFYFTVNISSQQLSKLLFWKWIEITSQLNQTNTFINKCARNKCKKNLIKKSFTISVFNYIMKLFFLSNNLPRFDTISHVSNILYKYSICAWFEP